MLTGKHLPEEQGLDQPKSRLMRALCSLMGLALYNVDSKDINVLHHLFRCKYRITERFFFSILFLNSINKYRSSIESGGLKSF